MTMPETSLDFAVPIVWSFLNDAPMAQIVANALGDLWREHRPAKGMTDFEMSVCSNKTYDQEIRVIGELKSVRSRVDLVRFAIHFLVCNNAPDTRIVASIRCTQNTIALYQHRPGRRAMLVRFGRVNWTEYPMSIFEFAAGH